MLADQRTFTFDSPGRWALLLHSMIFEAKRATNGCPTVDRGGSPAGYDQGRRRFLQRERKEVFACVGDWFETVTASQHSRDTNCRFLCVFFVLQGTSRNARS